jgi:hypothetical protein
MKAFQLINLYSNKFPRLYKLVQFNFYKNKIKFSKWQIKQKKLL